MAEVGGNSATSPSPAALAAIAEGVKLFPKDGELAYRVAMLYSENHDPKQARSLLQQGLQNTINDSLKLRMLELNRKLLER